MTDLDSAVIATLRAEAREAGMRTNSREQYEELSDRLDAVDRTHARSRWLLAVGVAATLVVAMVVVGRPAPSGPLVGSEPPSPAESQSGMRYTATNLEPDATVTLPGWTASALIDWKAYQGVLFTEGPCGEPAGAVACSEADDLKLRLESVTSFIPEPAAPQVLDPSYADVLGHLDALADGDVVVVADRGETEVAGRPATVMTLTAMHDAAGALGCPTVGTPKGECYPLIAGRTVRLALVDQGAKPPTLLYVSTNTDAPDSPDRLAELDAMLETVVWG